MGLAASQCRLLFLTSRQTDVSAKMQKISNSKMALARDEDEISDQYNKMLNGTIMKKVGSDVEITYANVMGESAAASGVTPAIIRKGGKVVLNGTYVTALQIGQDAITRGSGNKDDFGVSGPDEFIANMTGYDLSTIGKVTKLPTFDEYLKEKKFEETYGVKPDSSAVKTETVSNATDLLTMLTQGSQYTNMRAVVGGTVDTSQLDMNNPIHRLIAEVGNGDIKNHIYSTGATNTDQEVNLDIATAMGGGKTAVVMLGESEEEAKSSLAWYLDGVVNLFSSSGCSKDVVDSAQKARDDVYGKYTAIETSKTGYAIERKRKGHCQDDTKDKHTIVHSQYLEGAAGQGHYYFVSLTNLYNDYFDAFQTYEKKGGRSNGSSVTIKFEEKNEEGVTASQWQEEYDKLKKEWQNSVKNLGIDDDVLDKINFYRTIYEQAAKGWTIDPNVDDPAKFQEGLQNGTYTIDGKTAKNSELIEEVSDPDARAKAEHFWDVEMRKINRKEKEMDNQLQKLQTEYSGITSDIESVKSILNANIQKSFSYCQNG